MYFQLPHYIETRIFWYGMGSFQPQISILENIPEEKEIQLAELILLPTDGLMDNLSRILPTTERCKNLIYSHSLLHIMRITTEERMFLHLLRYYRYRDEKVVPYAITQYGIAEALGIGRAYIPVLLKRMRRKGKDMIEEEIKHITGLSKKRKVYFLTAYGYQKARKLRERLEAERVRIRIGEEETEIRLREMGKYMDHGDPLLSALNMMDENGFIDLNMVHEERKEDVFAGRGKEMERLRNFLGKVKEHGCSAVFITGEAGIGKTRLVTEFKKYAVKEGFEFLTGNAYYGTSEPYLPFREAFGKYSEKQERRTYIGMLEIEAIAGAEIEDKRMFDAERHAMWYDTTEWVKRIARARPLVIFLDDLQWSDQATLQLLHYMSAQLGDAPVLFIGTYRPEDVNEENPMWECRVRMLREHLFNEISLSPLRWRDTREIIRGITGKRDVPDGFVKMIHQATKGNPLFIKECVEEMLEEGIIDPKKGRYPETKKEIRIPKIVESVIKRRVKRLGKETRNVLQKASVIGENVPFDLLLSFTGMEEIELLEHLDILLDTGLLEEDPKEEIFSFSHSLIHLAIYRGIASVIRQRYHRAAGEKIEEIWKEKIEDYYSDLAYHYEMAGVYGKAVEYYYRAGHKAESLYAHEDAIRMLEKALELWNRAKKAEVSKMDILEELGDAYRILEEYEKARERYEEGLRGTEDVGRKQGLYAKMANTWERQGEYGKAIEAAEKGLALSDESSVESCRLLGRKGVTLMRLARYEEAIQIFEEEMRIAEELGAKKEMGRVLHQMGSVMFFLGDYDPALEYFLRAMEIWESIGERGKLRDTLNNIGVIHHRKGILDKALEYYQKSLKIRKEMGDRTGIGVSLNNIGVVYYDMGELDKALEYYERSLDIRKKIGDKLGIEASLNNIGVIYRIRGELDRALEYYQKSLEIEKEIGDKDSIAQCLSNSAEIYRYKKEPDKALEYDKEALKLAEEIGSKERKTAAFSGLAEDYLEIGDTGIALSYARKAFNVANEMNASPLIALSRRVLGMCYREKGDYDRAERELEKALTMSRDMGMKGEVGRGLYELGLLWAKKGSEEKAGEYLKEAFQVFESSGMELWAEKCRNAMKEL